MEIWKRDNEEILMCAQCSADGHLHEICAQYGANWQLKEIYVDCDSPHSMEWLTFLLQSSCCLHEMRDKQYDVCKYEFEKQYTVYTWQVRYSHETPELR